MNSYLLSGSSKLLQFLRYFLTLIFSSLILFLAIFFQKNLNEFVFITTYLLIGVIIYKSLKSFFNINYVLTFINEKELEISKKYSFLREQNKKVLISELKNYSYDTANGYIIFSLNSKRGKKSIFLFDFKGNNIETFNNLFNQLNLIIKKHNLNNQFDPIIIKPKLHETKKGFFLGLVILLSLIGIPICCFLFKSVINLGYLFILYPISVIYLYRVYLHWKE